MTDGAREHWGGGPLRALHGALELPGGAGLPALAGGPGPPALARRWLRDRRAGPGDRGPGQSCTVLGIDPAPEFVAYARSQSGDGRLRFEAGSAEALPAGAPSYDYVVSGLALNFMPDPQAAVAALRRAARPGGTLAAYVWDYAGGMAWLRYFWDAALALDASAASHDEGQRFPICQLGPLGELFVGGGLVDVRVEALEIETRFANFDDYWTPFLSGQFPGPRYLATLDDSRRAALCEVLRARLPVGADRSIRLLARLWAVRGNTP